MAGYVSRLSYSNLLHNWSLPSALRSQSKNAFCLRSSQMRKLHAFKVYEDPDGEWEPELDGDYFCRGVGGEPLIRYCEGGYHPVHLRDKLQDGRYEIASKLGWGRDGTVWLARDKA